MGENREGSCLVLEEKGDGAAVLRVEDCEEMGEDRLRVEREMEPRLEGCGDCLGFSQGEGTCFGWLGEEDGGNGVDAVKGSSSRGRRRVKCAAASREKIKTGWGAAVWKVIGSSLGLGFGFFCVFPQYVKLLPLCVL